MMAPLRWKKWMFYLLVMRLEMEITIHSGKWVSCLVKKLSTHQMSEMSARIRL